MKQYVLDVAGLSDRGVRREHNEDAWSQPPASLTSKQLAAKGRLYIVADGVGGHLAGDVASTMAVEIIQQHYYADSSTDIAASLTAAIQAASAQIDQEAAARPERRGMSTTVTAVVLQGNHLTVANVGDSRTYLVRKGQIRQITADHSWVEEQVRLGILTPEEAAGHPQRNIITRSLGSNQKLDVDIFEEQVEPGDSVLLCSDGLSNVVTDQEMTSAVDRGWHAESAASELVDLAKQRGAPDNVTVLLINVIRPTSSSCGQLALSLVILIGLAILSGILVYSLFFEREDDRVQPTLNSFSPGSLTLAATKALPTVASPLDTTLSSLELISPAESPSILAGQNITFTWLWKGNVEEEAGRFLFLLRTNDEAQPLLQEELPLSQTQYIHAEPLEPGGYIWTLSVVGSENSGTSAGRVFTIIEPTPGPEALATPTPSRSG
jgi:serine/threonine protein phosphatase PrpC